MISIVRTSTIPKRYLSDIYNNHLTDVNLLTFEELRAKIFGYFINEFDQYSYYLNKGEKYHCEEIITNDSILQKKWASEHGLNPNSSLDEIFLEQIKFYKPIIFVDNSSYFMSRNAEEFKQKYNVSKFIAWDGYTGSQFKQQSKGVDLIITCVEYIKNIYQDLGFESKLLPFGFDNRVFDQLKSSLTFQNRLCFTGSISDNVHKERKELLLTILKNKIPLELYISNIGNKNTWLSRAQIRAIKDFRLKDFKDYYTLQSHNSGGVYGIEMYKTIGQNAIQLNSHGDGSLQAGNMRLYEATGMGTLLLTDWKANIGSIFEPEKEIITYKNKAEAIDKINYYLKNTNEAKEIALNGQNRAFAQYSTQSRMMAFEKICDEILK
jgi:glycosyltransferase involved in cell wall biosynthesis